MLNKPPLLHQSFGPCVLLSFFLSLCLSLSGYFFGVQKSSVFTFLPGLLRPSGEGTLRLHHIERAPEASVNRASPMKGLSASTKEYQPLSLSFAFLSVNSGPPGSGPLKDHNNKELDMTEHTHEHPTSNFLR